MTESVSKLQEVGLIRYARGRIEVLDRKALEKRACECYALVEGEYRRLLSPKKVMAPNRRTGALRGTGAR